MEIEQLLAEDPALLDEQNGRHICVDIPHDDHVAIRPLARVKGLSIYVIDYIQRRRRGKKPDTATPLDSSPYGHGMIFYLFNRCPQS